MVQFPGDLDSLVLAVTHLKNSCPYSPNSWSAIQWQRSSRRPWARNRHNMMISMQVSGNGGPIVAW